jgi:hypothetical protein
VRDVASHRLQALRLLAKMKRRSIQHQQHLRARRLRTLGRIVEPGVLADVDAEHRALRFEHERPVIRREVALLVEDVIVRQVVLAISADDHPTLQDGGGVEAQALARERMTHHDREIRILQQLDREALQRRVARCVECSPQQQVLGWIAGQ